MLLSHLKRLISCSCILLLCMLTACSTQSNTPTTGSSNTPGSTSTQPQPLSQATTASTSSTPSHGVGPIVILSPTPVPGGNSSSQMIALPDRTLIINNVTKQPGDDPNLTAILLAITIENTSAKSILNEASFFQLIGAEGDTFGLQSNATTSFFAPITAKSSRNGTMIFQVPTAALNGLRLLYRSEIASETVFISLNL
jgi:hypothetical protein